MAKVKTIKIDPGDYKKVADEAKAGDRSLAAQLRIIFRERYNGAKA